MTTCCYIMVGIPGSGKSTWAERFGSQTGTEVVSSDSVRKDIFGDPRIQGDPDTVFTIVYDSANRALEENGRVVIDATNISKWSRNECMTRVHADKYVYVHMNVPLWKCLKRNEERERQVPEEVIWNMYQKLKKNPPADDGFGADVWVVHKSEVETGQMEVDT